MPIDRSTARALVDAGYMPLSEYVALFGDTVTAPDIVPSIERDARDDAAQEASAGALQGGTPALK
jgi:hypothetical protein